MSNKIYTADWIVTTNLETALNHRRKNPIPFAIKTKNGMFQTYPLGAVIVNDSDSGNRIGYILVEDKTVTMKAFE